MMNETYRVPRFTVAMAQDSAIDCNMLAKRWLGAQDVGTHEGAVKAAETRASHTGHHQELSNKGWNSRLSNENRTIYTHPSMSNRAITSNKNGSWTSHKTREAGQVGPSSRVAARGKTLDSLRNHLNQIHK